MAQQQREWEWELLRLAGKQQLEPEHPLVPSLLPRALRFLQHPPSTPGLTSQKRIG
jgi:hypothetical protein